MRVAYVNAAAGIAGDMLLGALVDAGARPAAVFGALAELGLDGYALTFERTQRGGIAAMWANVVVDADGPGHEHEHGDHGHPHRPAKDVRRLIERGELAPVVRDRALAVVAALAEAEGQVHGLAADDVELHEVGAVDAIVDIVGVAAALHDLGIEAVFVSPLAMGHGSVGAAHGTLPNPPPAVARLLARRSVPVTGVDTGMELSTPTGVALAVTLAESFGPLPAMTVDAVGYGAGTADPRARPNVVQVLVGDAVVADPAAPQPGREAVLLEANVDDVTGEVLAHAISALLAAGAHDAWAVPIVMKKGRPAHTVAALADPAAVEAVASVLVAETGSLGLRASTVARWPQARQELVVTVDGHAVRIKRSAGRVKVEHDDAVAVAAATGRPLRDILRDAESAGALS